MSTEGERVVIERLFSTSKLQYFDCEQGSNDLQIVCRDLGTREQAWIDRQLRDEDTAQARVLLAFFESWEPQAYAFEHLDGSAVIGLSSFFVFQLGFTFHTALAHKNFLSEVGNVNLELTVEELREIPLALRRPRCPERLRIARILFGIAFRFLTAHELTHILHGHLRLKLASNEPSNMAEQTHTLNKTRGLESQTLEMDADSGAVLLSLNTVMMPDEALQSEDGKGWDSLYRNRNLMAQLWSVAIYTLFRNLQGTPSRLEESSHPPPVKRSLIAFGTFLALQERDRASESDTSIRSSMHRAVIEVEELRSWILNKSPNLDPIRQALVLDNYVNKLSQEWARLRPLLEPLNKSKGKLAPV